ncbi:glycosyltransferase [Archangium gephyra]|uniref:glycosyltransferase n=1 Tax=Archangium gephyra TaxID=48 RepID=UPI003B809B66
MRVGIQGWGSEGDLRPLVALAARLKRDGHAPHLVLTSIDGTDYTRLCDTLGVPLTVTPRELAVSLPSLAKEGTSSDPSKLSRALLDQAFFPYLEEMYAAAVQLCERSDVVVGHLSCWYVKAAALVTDTPFVSLHYHPGLVPSRHQPPPGLPPWGWLNRPGWALLRAVLDLAFRKPAAAFFASKGLPRIRHALPDLLFSDQLNLFAASPVLCPPPRDLAPIHAICGAFSMEAEVTQWEPSADLRAFLDGGDKPVLLSLGTMEHLAPTQARELLIASAREAKVRAVIQTKRGAPEGQDGNLYFLPWAPHDRLLPLLSAVVHHGGAGTSHAVLRAGLPAVILPFIFEQAMWANQVHRVGAAAKPLSFWKAKPMHVAARIRQTLELEGLRQHARTLGAAMAMEDGTGVAVARLLSAFPE